MIILQDSYFEKKKDTPRVFSLASFLFLLFYPHIRIVSVLSVLYSESYLLLISGLFLGIQLLYIGLTAALWLTWRQIPVFQAASSEKPHTRITVVVVVRNEAPNITALLDSLARQTYPYHLYEVRIVDDFSTDTTPELIRNYQSQSPFQVHYIPLREYLTDQQAVGNFKKKAIELAVSQATGELIVTTDGDCQVPAGWLQTLAVYYQHTHAQLISGAVTFFSPTQSAMASRLFTHLQIVEFASLIGSGAATLQWNMPTMCNAANLAFTRKAFLEVGGYQDTAATATGDDLFLMHKIHIKYPQKIAFLSSPDCLVCTGSQHTLRDFYYQRKRWASKWNLYTDKRISLLAIFVFLSNFTLLGGLLATVLGYMPWYVWAGGTLVRWLTEGAFIHSILRRLQRTSSAFWIPLVQCIYPLYVIFFGIAVQKKGYQWKGRRLN